MTDPSGLNALRLCRLVEGLCAMPESLYRARLLSEQEHDDGSDSDAGSEPVVLPWLGWDSKTMLLTDLRNTFEAYTVGQSGDKRLKLHPVHSPSYEPEPKPAHGRVSFGEFARTLRMFGAAPE